MILTQLTIPRSVLFLVLLLSAAAGSAATVRGRLTRVYPGGHIGVVPGVAVTVFRSDIGRCSPAYTGNDGMFYLQGIPPGTYNLEIWISRDPQTPPIVYVIQVHEPFTDIPPINVD